MCLRNIMMENYVIITFLRNVLPNVFKTRYVINVIHNVTLYSGTPFAGCQMKRQCF